MARPEEFEPLFKMNRLGPPNGPTLPLPVRFRPVFYDPDLVEETLVADDDSVDLDQEITVINEMPTSLLFFKDPLCPPDMMMTQTEMDEMSPRPNKLGRNMRASQGHHGRHQTKSVLDIMNERRRLLDQQKEQQLNYNKDLESEQAAAVIVNDMLQHGFHITPPDSTPRPHQSSPSPTNIKSPITSSADEEHPVGPVDEDKLIVAMHHELKRVQHSLN